MRMIHKQTLEWIGNEEAHIYVPVHSLHLDVQMQGDDLTVWYLCDPKEQLKEKLTFRIVGTGWEIPDNFTQNHFWVKTIEHTGYIWHVFLKQTR